jgi:hypothetical protein
MKYMRHLFVVMLLLTMSACGDFDAQRLFVSHVTSFSNGELKNLRGGKVSCLHCPMYFKFDAGLELVAKIIAEQGLRPVASPPQEAREIEELVKREASWWQLADTKGQDKIYWIRYNVKRPELETAFRLLVVKGEHAFFITSGYFERTLPSSTIGRERPEPVTQCTDPFGTKIFAQATLIRQPGVVQTRYKFLGLALW